MNWWKPFSIVAALLLVLTFALGAADEQAGGAGAWEYKAVTADVSEHSTVVSTHPDHPGAKLPDTWHLQAVLERYADDGWQLDEMTAMPRDPLGHKVVLVFRRPAD